MAISSASAIGKPTSQILESEKREIGITKANGPRAGLGIRYADRHMGRLCKRHSRIASEPGDERQSVRSQLDENRERAVPLNSSHRANDRLGSQSAENDSWRECPISRK